MRLKQLLPIIDMDSELRLNIVTEDDVSLVAPSEAFVEYLVTKYNYDKRIKKLVLSKDGQRIDIGQITDEEILEEIKQHR